MLRIYHPESINRNIQLNTEQRHYIVNVRRLTVGSELIIFNSLKNEFLFVIEKIDRSNIYCTKVQQLHNPEPEQRFSLAVPVISPNRLEWLFEKAVEIGVANLYLIHTQFSTKRSINYERLTKIVIAALQQSNRIHMPLLHNPMSLDQFLRLGLNIMVANVKGEQIIPTTKPTTLLLGPEGCFSADEMLKLEQCPKMRIVADGILRTETAAIAGLTLFKASV